MITILDVSLRDGGHRTNFHFQDEELQSLLTPLDNSGLDYIEIGYRNGSIHPIADIGRAGLCDRDYMQYCRELIKKSKVAVMAHPKNIGEADLQELRECGVDLLRLCVVKNELAEALPSIELAKQHDLMVSVNFIHVSHYNDDELEQVINTVSPYKPDLIYFADSNGSLLPERTKEIFTQYNKNNYDMSFGFHAHDNLGLAQANTIAALNAGADYIDSALAGMGKGTGNLKTEFFIAYLQAIKHDKYNLDELLKAANYAREQLKIGSEPLIMDEFIRGIHDLSTAEMKKLKEQAS